MWNEAKLDEMLSTPAPALVKALAGLSGDILVLGAGGKMGPSLCLLAKRALDAAGNRARIIAVSRFGDPVAAKLLTDNGITLVSSDLLEPGALEKLPDAENVIYMAGRKFGTGGSEALTWAMNAWLPSRVAERYKSSRIVVFSTGNVYPQVPVTSGGATEDTPPAPVGDYGMSSLARERMFEYAAGAFGTKIAIFRLNYAVDLRYGVLYDIASRVISGEPVSLATPCFNCIWQADACSAAIRCLFHASEDVFRLNVTGPETASVKKTAERLGAILGKKPVFEGSEGTTALLNDAGKMFSLFGYPTVPYDTLLEWQAAWITDGGRALGKPTHFEEKEGKY